MNISSTYTYVFYHAIKQESKNQSTSKYKSISKKYLPDRVQVAQLQNQNKILASLQLGNNNVDQGQLKVKGSSNRMLPRF